MGGVGPTSVPAGGRSCRRGLVAITLVTVAVLGACGSGDDDSDAAGDTTAMIDASGTSVAGTTVAGPGATTTSGPTVVSTPTVSVPPGYTTEPADGALRQGQAGPRVYLLQSQLVALGYDAGPLDGQFGAKTHAAVVAFQRDKTLAMDGVVGPQTASALAAACRPVPSCPSG
jgi:peptidoglycan hydrolase-like protein with peptidoglycan-binding domain